MRGTAPAGAFRSATAEGGSWRVDNPRRDTPSARTKQRILRIRCLGAFLETGLLDPPPAALRLFPCAIEILSFQNFCKVLKTCSAGRKNFRHAEKGTADFRCSFCIYASKTISRVLYLTVIYLDVPLPVRSSHPGSGRASLGTRSPCSHTGVAPDRVYSDGCFDAPSGELLPRLSTLTARATPWR